MKEHDNALIRRLNIYTEPPPGLSGVDAPAYDADHVSIIGVTG